MVPVPIGRFHDQGISSLRRDWIPDYCQTTSADVAGKDESFCLSPFRTVHQHGCRAKNMTSVDIAGAYPRDDVERLVVGDTDHQIHCAHGVSHSVDRLYEFLLPLREKLGVFLLDMRGVRKHYGAQVAGRGGRPDRFGVTLPDQVRKTPRVVDVSMR